MLIRNAIDLFALNAKKNLLSILTAAVGIFLAFYLGVSLISQEHTYNTINAALDGKAERFGWVSFDMEDEDLCEDLIRELTGRENVYGATFSYTDTALGELYPELRQQYQMLHPGESEITVRVASARFLRDCGLRLEGDRSWDDIIRLLSGNTTENVFLLPGAAYRYIAPDLPSEAAAQNSERSSSAGYITAGMLADDQTILGEDFQYNLGNDLQFTYSADTEIILLCPDELFNSLFYFDTGNGSVQSEISAVAAQKGIPYEEMTVYTFSVYYREFFRETEAISATLKRTLAVFLPALLLFIIILQLEMFAEERKHLGILSICGFSTRYLMGIELAKNMIAMLLSIGLAGTALVLVLPRHYDTEISTIIRVAFAESVIPAVLVFTAFIVAVQIIVIGICLHRSSVIDSIREDG